MNHVVEITYFTGHIAKMIDFYQKILDTEPNERGEGHASFFTGAVNLFLHAAYTPAEGELPPVDHVAVAVRNVDAACQALSEKGIAVDVPPKEYYRGKSAYVIDPDGHQVEIHQTSPDWSNSHRYFSSACFNSTWDLLDKKDRSHEEDEAMVSLVFASLYHWKQRPDCTNQNLSVGYWLAARVYAVLSQAENARRYGQLCLEYSQDTPVFYTGYAFEALARAELLAGNRAQARAYLDQALACSAQLSDPEEKDLLNPDLAQIESLLSQR
jgi:catechol 2,3-dioxygenase-like lactoylglutathione lyase family enzyme